MTSAEQPVRILFICWGNICRSPMAKVMALAEAETRRLQLQIDSAGVSREETGNPIDRRARLILEEGGFTPIEHSAHQVTAAEITAATVVVAAEQRHLDLIRSMVPEATNLRLFSDWIDDWPAGAPLPDPWYGDLDDYRSTLAALQVAVPAILDDPLRPARRY